jgi:hypothetical protein
MLLAEYGAEVYKLESRDGNMGRGWGRHSPAAWPAFFPRA